MKLYTLLSKDLYQIKYSVKIVSVVMMLLYGAFAYMFIVGGLRPPALIILLMLFFVVLVLPAITSFSPAMAKLFGKKISIDKDRICIYTHKSQLLKTYPFVVLIATSKNVIFHSIRGAPVVRRCLVLHTDPNLFNDNSDFPAFSKLQTTEDTFVIQNPEVIALLEQIFAVEKK